MTPNDPLYASQWHFSLIGDIETIWTEFTGKGVNLAVYDDGLQHSHPDLSGNYDSSLHFQYQGQTYDPAPIDLRFDGHGTSVAGVIVAQANDIGGVGVAHGASLTGINLLEQLADEPKDAEYAAWRHGAEFDILSNSWGYRPIFTPFLDGGDARSGVSRILRNLDDAVETGRDGKGSAVVFAAGNNDLNIGGSGLANARQTIVVAATDEGGNAEWYSNWGPAILVAAPAAEITTDLMGTDGYDLGDYTDSFGGTSGAAPVVSGVVALMLEANPDLGWRDVQNILALSAAHTGGGFKAIGDIDEVAPWSENGATHWNGGGLTFHPNYGFGMVDAFAAVRMAEVWTQLHGVARTSDNEQRVSASAVIDQPITDFAPTEHQIDVATAIDIEHITVTFDITHDDLNTVNLTLVAPTGEEFLLLLPQPGDQISGSITSLEFSIGVTAALGTSSAGTWTIQATDLTEGGQGFFKSASLEFYGQAPTVDDVYHFTEDFEDLASTDHSRIFIRDTNGGTDWVNFAGFQQAVDLDLEGGDLRFDGHFQSRIRHGQIENAVTGDGDDIVMGGATDNHLMGQRGNDDLRGRDGMDLLEGGAGNDTLWGNDAVDMGIAAEVSEATNEEPARETGDAFSDIPPGPSNDHNVLLGGAGDDLLMGARSDDTLDGGTGDDQLTGYEGADDFIYNKGYGHDVIHDFTEGADSLILDALLWADDLSTDQVLSFANVQGDNLVFDFGGGDSLTLNHVAQAKDILDDLIIV